MEGTKWLIYVEQIKPVLWQRASSSLKYKFEMTGVEKDEDVFTDLLEVRSYDICCFWLKFRYCDILLWHTWLNYLKLYLNYKKPLNKNNKKKFESEFETM